MCITDVLFDLLITDIRRQVGIDDTNGLSRLEFFINNDCHIPFKFLLSKETKKLQWHDLMGPEKLILFHKIQLVTMFPNIKNVNRMQKLWKEFEDLHNLLQCENILGKMLNNG